MTTFEEEFPSLNGAEHFMERDDKREEPVFFAEAIDTCCLDKQRVREVFEELELRDKELEEADATSFLNSRDSEKDFPKYYKMKKELGL